MSHSFRAELNTRAVKRDARLIRSRSQWGAKGSVAQNDTMPEAVAVYRPYKY